MISIANVLAQLNFLHWLWLFFIAFVLHEVEEWNIDQFERRYFTGLPADATDRSARMWIAFVILLGLVWITAATLPGHPTTAAWIFLPAIAILFQNALQHVFWSFYFRQVAPGVGTSVVLLIPVGLYVFVQAVQQGYVPVWYALIWVALMMVGMLQTVLAGNQMTPLIRGINHLGIQLAQRIR